MTWTYDVTMLDSSQKDQIRLLIGDTDRNDQQLQDEEIAYALVLHPDTQYAAARCCELVAAFYARQVTTNVGRLRVEAADKQKHYLELAMNIRRQASLSAGAAPIAPAVSRAAKEAADEDEDRVEPYFFRGMDENPNKETGDPFAAALLQGAFR